MVCDVIEIVVSGKNSKYYIPSTYVKCYAKKYPKCICCLTIGHALDRKHPYSSSLWFAFLAPTVCLHPNYGCLSLNSCYIRKAQWKWNLYAWSNSILSATRLMSLTGSPGCSICHLPFGSQAMH